MEVCLQEGSGLGLSAKWITEALRKKVVVMAMMIVEVGLVVHAVGDHRKGVLPRLAGKTAYLAMPSSKALAQRVRSAAFGTLLFACTSARASAARARTALVSIVRNLKRSAILLAQLPPLSKSLLLRLKLQQKLCQNLKLMQKLI